jgi:hypothetical protein
MRNILLAGAALLATTGMAMASGDALVQLSSTVVKNCTITSGGNIALSTTGAPENGSFTTDCNFSLANLTISMTSANGGLKNTDENVTVPYDVIYNSQTKLSSTLTTAQAFTAEPAGGAAVVRNFVVDLATPLTVGGSYADTLTISVAP